MVVQPLRLCACGHFRHCSGQEIWPVCAVSYLKEAPQNGSVLRILLIHQNVSKMGQNLWGVDPPGYKLVATLQCHRLCDDVMCQNPPAPIAPPKWKFKFRTHKRSWLTSFTKNTTGADFASLGWSSEPLLSVSDPKSSRSSNPEDPGEWSKNGKVGPKTGPTISHTTN